MKGADLFFDDIIFIMQKVIVITGGSEGLGYETAKILAPDNKVIIVAHNPKKIEAAAKKLTCDFEFCDVTSPANITEAVKNIYKKYKRIDCLINNAGIFFKGEITANTEEEIRQLLDVNVFGAIMFAREIIPIMKKQKSGLIINTVSQGGIYAKADRSLYAASKFALNGFTKSLQPELAKYGIRVSGIYPGKIKTDLLRKAGYKNIDLLDALRPSQVARSFKFIIDQDPDVVITDIGIKHIKN